MKFLMAMVLALSIGMFAPLPANGSIELTRGATESTAAFEARKSATCPASRACAWSGYWDSADQGSLWYYTLARMQEGVDWSGTAADLNTSSWYNRTSGYMLMANNASCSTSIGWYVRLAPGQVANGRNPATNWDNAFRSLFGQPPSPC